MRPRVHHVAPLGRCACLPRRCSVSNGGLFAPACLDGVCGNRTSASCCIGGPTPVGTTATAGILSLMTRSLGLHADLSTQQTGHVRNHPSSASDVPQCAVVCSILLVICTGVGWHWWHMVVARVTGCQQCAVHGTDKKSGDNTGSLALSRVNESTDAVPRYCSICESRSTACTWCHRNRLHQTWTRTRQSLTVRGFIDAQTREDLTL